MSDLIERQAAIDALDVGAELLRRVLDDADVVGTDREKYSWGLGLIESYIEDIEELPPAQPKTKCIAEIKTSKEDMEELISEKIEEFKAAQPEIIRCRDCVYGEQDEDRVWFCRNLGCQIGDIYGNGFCSDAERRTDE